QNAEAFSLALQNAAFRGLGHQSFIAVLEERVDTVLQTLIASPWQPSLTLELRSPVRLQAHGALVTTAPSFAQVFASAQRKLRLAARSWCSLELPFPSEQMHLARHIPVAMASVRWVEMARYSLRQRQFMRLGGLQGRLQFEGEWSFAWPWLRFLPAIGLGKLTTMGFGDVAWTHNSNTKPST
ncbi:MAG: CRISPR system precrRNA processing endoribonuclease RAMP protein Cas6, partial [Thermoanaerobaculum sp.]